MANTAMAAAGEANLAHSLQTIEKGGRNGVDTDLGEVGQGR